MPKQPKLSIPLTSLDISAEIISFAGLTAICLIYLLMVPELPNTIPTHFGISGSPDGWGPKSSMYVTLWVALGEYVMLTILSLFPNIYNYPWPITEANARAQYTIGRSMMIWLKAEVVWLMTYVAWGTISVAMGRSHTTSELGPCPSFSH